MTVNTIEFPSDLEILMTREFEAPIELVFDVFTKQEHVRNTFPPFGEEMAVCDIALTPAQREYKKGSRVKATLKLPEKDVMQEVNRVTVGSAE